MHFVDFQKCRTQYCVHEVFLRWDLALSQLVPLPALTQFNALMFFGGIEQLEREADQSCPFLPTLRMRWAILI